MKKVKKMAIGGLGRSERTPIQRAPISQVMRGVGANPAQTGLRGMANRPIGMPMAGIGGRLSQASVAEPQRVAASQMGDTFMGRSVGATPAGIMSGLGRMASAGAPASTSPRMKKGGKVKTASASKRADGIAQRGKTRGKII